MTYGTGRDHGAGGRGDGGGAVAHSRYNALTGGLVGFERALAREKIARQDEAADD